MPATRSNGGIGFGCLLGVGRPPLYQVQLVDVEWFPLVPQPNPGFVGIRDLRDRKCHRVRRGAVYHMRQRLIEALGPCLE